MKKFYFYKTGRHFVLGDIQKAERARISIMKRHQLEVFHLSTTDVVLPSHVICKRKFVCVVAETAESAVSWLKTQKWSEL